MVGNNCEPDTFARDRLLPKVRGGGLLAFHRAGAYGFEVSNAFNRRPRSARGLLENGVLRQIRRQRKGAGKGARAYL